MCGSKIRPPEGGGFVRWLKLINEEGKIAAYCVRCKKKVVVKNPQRVAMKNTRPATKGVCPGCGTTVYRIGQAGVGPGASL